MKMKKQIRLSAAVVLFTCSAMAQGAQPRDIDQLQLEWFGVSTLKNVREVYPQVALEIVEINAPEPNFTSQIGPLMQKDMQSHLEQMLQKSGIRTTSKFSATATNAPLSLNVTVFAKVRENVTQPAWAVFIYTEALQPVILLRDAKIRTFGRTWPMVPTGAGTRNLLLLTDETIMKEVTDEVTRQVTNFIIDYSAANPAMRIVIPQPARPEQEQPEIEQPETIPPNVTDQNQDEPDVNSGVVMNIPFRIGFRFPSYGFRRKYAPISFPAEFQMGRFRVNLQVGTRPGEPGLHVWGPVISLDNTIRE
jgi:hypothetical protein